MPHARRRQVDGEDEGPTARLPRLLQQGLHDAAIAQHVELEPDRLRDSPGHLGQRADPHGGQGEGHAYSCGRPGGQNLAAARHHPGEPDRRERQRHAAGLSEEGGGGVHALDVHEHALTQRDPGPVRLIGPQGLLVGGAAVDVVEQEARQARSRQSPVVFSGRGQLQSHAASFPWRSTRTNAPGLGRVRRRSSRYERERPSVHAGDEPGAMVHTGSIRRQPALRS